MVTIKQIAELSQVSRGTVDKVLNNRPGVKKQTREKILKIAKELNYKPNFIGKALVNNKTPIKIGVVLTPEYNPFVQQTLMGIQSAIDEFSAFGIKVIIKMASTLEPAEQISILNDLKNECVTGIAVFPINDPQVISLINQFAKDGISIVTFNSDIKDIDSLCFIGQNHYKGGRTAAELMRKLLPDGGDIGIIISSNNLSCHQDRLLGFKDKLTGNIANLNIVEIQENQDKKDEAFRITLEYCNKYPNLKGIYITSGGVAGIGSALNLLQLNGQIKVICHDIIQDSIELLKSQTIDFVIGQNAYLQGYKIIKTLFEQLVRGIGPNTKFDEIPINITTYESL